MNSEKKQEKLAKARKEREEVLAKIAEYEKLGGQHYFIDVEPDPEGHPLAPDEVDYLQKKTGNKIKSFFARRLADVALLHFSRDLKIKLEGTENLEKLDKNRGVIITSNHFSKFENLCVMKVAKKIKGHHRFWRVIKGNNVFICGIIGFFMKHCDTLPLSTNLQTTRLFRDAVSKILSDGGAVLIYPEQAMWWNYRKPRPHREGAGFYATKNNVPILPLFVTMEDQEGRFDEAGYPKQAYTVHIMPPIYPDENKSLRDNEENLVKENERLCREMYEKTYGVKM